MDIESKIRKLMRDFDRTCPACGSECISVENELDTDLGVMDTCVCADCENEFIFSSSILTQIINTGNSNIEEEEDD